MKQIKVIAREGKFKYYDGTERRYVMVAVRGTLEKEDAVGNTIANYVASVSSLPEEAMFEDAWPIERVLQIGVAVCNPLDEFSFDKGQQIATDKVLEGNFRRSLAVSHHGMIDEGLMSYLLNKEMKVFEKDPGSFLKQYNKDKDQFKHEEDLKKCAMDLTTDEAAYMNVVTTYHPEYLKLLRELASRPELVEQARKEWDKHVDKP